MGELDLPDGKERSLACFRRGLSLLGRNRFAEAASDFQRCVEQNPLQCKPLALNNLALALEGMGEHDRAIEASKSVGNANISRMFANSARP